MNKEWLSNADWIWCNSNPHQDEYGEFIDEFMYDAGSVVLRISADSNYATYINGELAAWGQYADFPYDKVYDEVDITAFCKKGINRIATVVWYYGLDYIFVYYPGKAGLLYEVVCDDTVLCHTDRNTRARMSHAYRNHRMRILSMQLGLGYGYDATREDVWLTGELVGFSNATVVKQTLPLRKRPCDKLVFLEEVPGVECKRISDTDVIFDLGKEQVGFLSLKLNSPCDQEIVISYGEHIEDGCVRRIIENRDFSASYRAKKGENQYLNPFRRFACRYLEVHSEVPLLVEKMVIVPTMYVLEEKTRPMLNEKQNKIYDMCVETLHLCMHEHYEDCPWREQALYAMDSRNQMLCGYYAFHEYRFPRANLELISKDNRPDGLLSICYPMCMDYVIVSFSLHYITACKEYLQYSGDKEFLKVIYPKLASIMEAFTKRIEDGLVHPFEGDCYWNFYEWRPHLNGEGELVGKSDLILNALVSLGLQNMAIIAEEIGVAQDYLHKAESLNRHIRESFWNAEESICYDSPEHVLCSQLGNALAVLCGAIIGQEAQAVAEHLVADQTLTPISLSMVCFKYDALLKVDRETYASFVLEDIEKIYTPMIDFGSTTVWETELGQADFSNAGSLCHGWSALPIYYYHILLG